MQKIKITHIITGLNMGGAETMLHKLLKHIDRDKYEVNVISMMDDGVYGEKIRDLGFEVICLYMKQGIPGFKGFIKARRHIKKTDIVQTWMYHADLFGYLLCRFSNVKKLIWGIRRTSLDLKLNKKSTIAIAKINSRISKRVDVVVSCSIKAKEVHREFGYFNGNLLVIPNGFELKRFNKEMGAKLKVSNIIKKEESIPYILHVGRWNILKDYENFFKALKDIKDQGIDFQAILAGTNINQDNPELMSLINQYKLINSISLLGRRDDIPTIMSGSDVFVSSSNSEGFPNVVGEAMACETPCVVTDVGDSAYIVGETGVVVPSKNAHALAKGILKIVRLTDEERKKLGFKARRRVEDNFDIHTVTTQFEKLYYI